MRLSPPTSDGTESAATHQPAHSDEPLDDRVSVLSVRPWSRVEHDVTPPRRRWNSDCVVRIRHPATKHPGGRLSARQGTRRAKRPDMRRDRCESCPPPWFPGSRVRTGHVVQERLSPCGRVRS